MRTPRRSDLNRVRRRPPAQGCKDPTLDAEREPQEAHGGTLRGLPGSKGGKGRGRGGRECPEEEEYCSRHPAPEQSEDAQKAEGQTNPDHLGKEGALIQANGRPEATHPPPYPQDLRPLREVRCPGGGKHLPEPPTAGEEERPWESESAGRSLGRGQQSNGKETA